MVKKKEEKEEEKFKLANDQNTSAEKLVELSEIGDFQLNQIILNHPNTPKSLIEKLLNDEEYDYAFFLPENPKLPELKRRRELSHLLFNDFTKEKDFSSLMKMIPLLNDRYLAYIAVNHHTPPQVLTDLAERGGDYLKRLIAKNPNTPPKTLKMLEKI